MDRQAREAPGGQVALGRQLIYQELHLFPHTPPRPNHATTNQVDKGPLALIAIASLGIAVSFPSRYHCRPSACAGLSPARSTTAAPPRPGPFGRRRAQPSIRAGRAARGRARDGSRVHSVHDRRGRSPAMPPGGLAATTRSSSPCLPRDRNRPHREFPPAEYPAGTYRRSPYPSGSIWCALVLQLQFAISAGQEPDFECSELTGRHVAGVRDRRRVAGSGSVWRWLGDCGASGTVSVRARCPARGRQAARSLADFCHRERGEG